MKTLLLIGIGTGNPDHLTGEARKAIASAAVILIPDKGAGKSDLADLRTQIVADIRSLDDTVRTFEMPVRDPALPYLEAVEAWHDEIACRWAEAAGGAETVALLVWGDPSLYDSTLRIAERLIPKPEMKVIAGLTSLQLLTAAHAIPLNTLAAPVTITTGRQLRDHGWPEGAETLAVMLDGACAFEGLEADAFEIWWGAYVGMPEEVLIAGPLADVSTQILQTRARERDRHGWIMDIYLLRRLS